MEDRTSRLLFANRYRQEFKDKVYLWREDMRMAIEDGDDALERLKKRAKKCWDWRPRDLPPKEESETMTM